ncbi:hypothetical protein E3P99_04040 [Wallemia hederae]|uniref:ATP-dependent DNA helicase n=1 Tax=Wallemia hederae TaxID=1540922 RepID=A0A4T0FDV0_9BASI|nr:hypothetical protein E3P99_04040 [Wallemia hederae]
MPISPSSSSSTKRKRDENSEDSEHRKREMNSAEAAAKSLSPSPSPSLSLSPSQQSAINLILTGTNVFLTGGAGSGKSHLLNAAISHLQALHGRRRVGITATTGVASTHISGVTTHSWSGITNSQLSVSGLVVSIKMDARKLSHWCNTRVLIIDEISMLDGAFLDKLNDVAKRVRKSEKAFGGIQLVFCGDFYQLPPVSLNNRRSFAFESTAWKECALVTAHLTESFRQANDTVFQDILNEARKGALTEKSILQLYQVQRRGTAAAKRSLQPLQVFAKRARVDAANKRQLTNLNNPIHTFVARDKLVKRAALKNVKMALNAAMTLAEEVEICEGAQVMLVKNLDTSRGLVNGAVGVVESVGTYTKLSRDDEDNEDGSEKEDGMILPSLTSSSARKVLYKASSAQDTEGKRGVLVRFHNGLRGIVSPLKVEMEDDVGDTLATRFQLPLILAWATTIHKSQGQTLPSVTVHLDEVFEHGMAYVALSRVRCLDHLQIKGFDKSRFIVDKKVKKFDTS